VQVGAQAVGWLLLVAGAGLLLMGGRRLTALQSQSAAAQLGAQAALMAAGECVVVLLERSWLLVSVL
jgi:hypothetical protein